MTERLLVNASFTESLYRDKESKRFWLERHEESDKFLSITSDEAIRWIEENIWDLDHDGLHMLVAICKEDLGIEPPKWILEFIEDPESYGYPRFNS